MCLCLETLDSMIIIMTYMGLFVQASDYALNVDQLRLLESNADFDQLIFKIL